MTRYCGDADGSVSVGEGSTVVSANQPVDDFGLLGADKFHHSALGDALGAFNRLGVTQLRHEVVTGTSIFGRVSRSLPPSMRAISSAIAAMTKNSP